MRGKATFVVGLQYGDEGKGKIVDHLAEVNDLVIRGNGGSNAGHTIVLPNGETLALHQMPSGVAYKNTLNIIGHGCFLDPVKLLGEVEDAKTKGVDISPKNLQISKTAHLVLPIHKILDEKREGGDKGQGSTKAGIAYVASDKALREGVRAEIILAKDKDELITIGLKGLSDLDNAQSLAEDFAACCIELKPYFCDNVELAHNKIKEGKNVLVEGAQAFGLDINNGKYPYTTSSDTTVSGLLSGTGLNYKQVGKVIGVAKAIPSKVGGGAFVTAIKDAKIANLARGEKGKVDSEFGATTGRAREVGYLDLVALKRAVQVNGIDELALTKFDCINRYGGTTKVAVAYNFNGQEITSPPSSDQELAQCEPIYQDFPTWQDNNSTEAKKYLEFIEDYLGIPITMVGIGPERSDLIFRNK